MERVIERVDLQIPMQPRALCVCAYARVSSGKDAMLHSLSAQVSYYNSLIQSHAGWLYCGVYSDEAITGTKSQRDGFQRMLASCRAGGNRPHHYKKYLPLRQKYGHAAGNRPGTEKPGCRCFL